MDTASALKLLWPTSESGAAPDKALAGQLASMDEGYRVQFGILDKHRGQGQQLSGWKIGLTAPGLREKLGVSEPASGYLLARRRIASGSEVKHAAIGTPRLETEMCMTLGTRLAGADVTRADAARAVSLVAPAFEIVDMRMAIGGDLPLLVADDIVHWGYVVGEAVPLAGIKEDLGAVVADIRCNGKTYLQALGREVMDHQLDVVAWLARQLHKYGLALEAGQEVMTGSFNTPAPIAKGDRWEASLSGIGSVSAVFV